MRPAFIFLAADACSLFGNAIAAVAFPWLVFAVTGHAGQAGIVATAAAVPALLATVVGGHVTDRFGRRRIAIGADVLSALSLAALPVVDATAGLTMAWLVPLAVLGAIIDGPGATARDAMLHDIAAASGWPLERVASARETIAGTAILAGPGLAGVLLANFSTSAVLWSSVAASLLAAGLTMLTRTPSASDIATFPEGTEEIRAGAGLWRSVVGGVQALRSDRVIWMLTLIGAGTAAVVGPIQSLLLPGIFNAWNQPASLGLATSALAGGSVLGALIYAAMGTKLSRRTLLTASLVLAAVGFGLLAPLVSSPVVIGAMATIGLGTGLSAPLLPVLMAERVPVEVRGRVLAWQNAGALAALPVGLMATGAIAGATDLRTASTMLACCWMLVAAVGIRLSLSASPGESTRPAGSREPGRCS